MTSLDIVLLILLVCGSLLAVTVTVTYLVNNGREGILWLLLFLGKTVLVILKILQIIFNTKG